MSVFKRYKYIMPGRTRSTKRKNLRSLKDDPESKETSVQKLKKRMKKDPRPSKDVNEDPIGILQSDDTEHNSCSLKCDEQLNLNFKIRKNEPKINVFTPMTERSENLIHFLQQYSLGGKCKKKLSQSLSGSVVNMISEMSLCRTASPFDRRVTAMEWHPTKPNILLVGSKGGDLILWDTSQFNKDKFIQGIGAGGNVQAMKFWPEDHNKAVVAGLDGRVKQYDFPTETLVSVLSDTMNFYDYWYCSVDVSSKHKVVVAGDNTGYVQLLSYHGSKIFNVRLHKNKVTNAEFSPREEWLMCTSSTDQTVQLWDIRMMKDRKSCLQSLKHNRAVNSAYFSKTDGCKLLTTDQYNQVRVYQAPEWTLLRTIEHPHRFFQHITPIKATWHPLQDLAVVGRYPDPNDPAYYEGELRTIDIINTDTGELVVSLDDPSALGLICVNKFNNQGDVLASGMGLNILLWKRKVDVQKTRESLLNSVSLTLPGRALPSSGSQNGSNSRQSTDLRKKRKLDLEKKSSTKSKTKKNETLTLKSKGKPSKK